jgi:peptidyl-prolyl cis-trans isomerase C
MLIKKFASQARIVRSLLAIVPALLLLSPVANAETVVTVNGKAVDSTVFETYAETRTRKPFDQVTAEEKEALVSELVDIILLANEAEAAGLEKDPLLGAQLYLQRLGLMAQAGATSYVAKNPAQDSEIVAEYERIELAPPLQYKARHILVESQGEAAAIIKELDDGADFVELAKEKSIGPSGPNGGDLGWFSPDQMVEPFSNAVVALGQGAYTKTPVQTQYGWHVILREDSRESDVMPLDSVRDAIKQSLEQEKLQRYLESLRSAAKVEKPQ